MINDSRVSDNTADTSSAVPSGVDQSAVAGGVQVQGNASGTVRSTTISGNSVSSTSTVGGALAFSGGFHADGPIVLRDSTVSDNSVVATAAVGRARPTRAPARSTRTRRSATRASLATV